MAYVAGKWKAQCQRCGRDYLSSQLKREWTGLRVCSGEGTSDCWDPRHPLDRLRGKKDRQSVPWTSPEIDGPDVSPGSGNEVSPGDL